MKKSGVLIELFIKSEFKNLPVKKAFIASCRDNERLHINILVDSDADEVHKIFMNHERVKPSEFAIEKKLVYADLKVS